MTFSIRTRLILGMTSLIIFFVLFSLLLNSRYLAKYYISEKRETLIESKKMIEERYTGDPDKLSFELENLERNRGINVFFLNPDFNFDENFPPRIYLPENRRRNFERLPLIHSIKLKLEALDDREVITDIMVDPRLSTQFLVLASKLDNGDILVLSTPIAAIHESTRIANRFFMITGLITIILGGIGVYLLANRFTRPILELNEIAQGMAKLDFRKKYVVKSDDEVGELGKSINSLSDQLDEAISDLREANKKLMADIEHERRIDRMRKEFISNVSHELKTPIALIQGYAEGLKLNINENEEDRDFYCDVIMDETGKMNRLVVDLLNLSQIESGNFKLEIGIFDISSLVDHVLDKFRPILAEKGIELRVEKQKDVAVVGDITRIEQVLVNFLTNAANHVDDNKLIQVTVAGMKGKIRVKVYNSGPNIPEASLDKIWTSFYKVDKARTRAYGGTGLGLSVVRAILENHGNAYGVENEKDGVTFWFELNVKRNCNPIDGSPDPQ